MPTFRVETLIEAPVAACFALSLSVDAHTSSMGSARERAVAGVTEGQLSEGDWVTWQARHFGLPFRMTVGVTSMDAPHRFVDEQLRGPFASWRHEHLFAEHDEATMMVDQIQFRSPLGPAGTVVDRTVLGRYMTRLVQQRNSWLKTTLEPEPPVPMK